MRFAIVFIGLSAALGTGLAPRAFATALPPITLEELARQSDRIVLGDVRNVTAVPYGPNGQSGIFSRVTLRVDASLPATDGSAIAFWVHGGRIGSRMRRVIGQARFSIGERVAVFLRRGPSVEGSQRDAPLWPTQMARGKWLRSWDHGTPYVRPSVQLGGARPSGRGPVAATVPMSGAASDTHLALTEGEFWARVHHARAAR
jgi:hypothetical protein